MAQQYIDDFGQKIGGAKKDLWKSRGLRIEDLDDIDLREYLEFITKDNIWPTPNYTGYVEGGMAPVCTYFMKAIRELVQGKTEVKNDGNDRDRAARYITFIQDIKDSCEKVMTKEDIKKYSNILLVDHGYQDELGKPSAKGKDVPGLDYAFMQNINYSSEEILAIDIETKIMDFPNDFRGDLKGVRIKSSHWDKKFYIMKGDKKLVPNAFESFEDALEFATTDLKDVMDGKKVDKKRERKVLRVIRPQLQFIERTGPDLRRGQNASSDHLLNAFKFRGGEFGNWNTQDDRQAYINYAFDAFVDLGYILKCPLDFLAFNPKGGYKNQALAIAFGARGSGAEQAHYEPERVVINLTKMRGAGCLAHEWGIALDDFLGCRCGVTGTKTFLSENTGLEGSQYDKIVKAMQQVMQVIKQKEPSGVEVLAERQREIESHKNRILRGLVDPEVKKFNADHSGVKPTDEQVKEMDDIVAKLYDTGDRKYYDKFLELFRLVKNYVPGFETRRYVEQSIQHIEYIKESIEHYNRNGRFEHTGIKDTSFYKAARLLDRGRTQPLYMGSRELFARAFESYIEDTLGFKSQYLVHSTQDNSVYGDLRPYPEGDERKAINAAMKDFLKLVVETFASPDSKMNYNIYENFTDRENKYSRQRLFGPAAKKDNVQTVEQGKKIKDALVEVYVGFMKEVDSQQSTKTLEIVQNVLEDTGKNYYKGNASKVRPTEPAEGETEPGVFTCIIYNGLLLLPAPTGYITLRDKLKERIIKDAGADDCLVRVITPELEGLEDFGPTEFLKYTKAIAGIVREDTPVQEAPVQQTAKTAQTTETKLAIKTIDSISNSKELREYLVDAAGKLLTGKLYVTYEQLYNALAQLCATELQLGVVTEGDMPVKLAQGNSKAWRVEKQRLIISKNEPIEKKLEGIIEPIIKILTMRKYKGVAEAEQGMISSAVTYMICKRLGLDVRTYCLDASYDRVIGNKNNLKSYINVCCGLYKEAARQLYINKAIH